MGAVAAVKHDGGASGQVRLIIATGRRGGGKSSLAKEAVNYCRRVLVWDPHGEYTTISNRLTDEDEVYDFLQEAAEDGLTKFAARFVPEYASEAQAETLCYHAYEYAKKNPGGLLLVLDEAAELMTAAHTPRELKRCLNLGRHASLSMLLVTTRLSLISRTASGLADGFVVCGSITEPADLESLRDRTDEDFVNRVRDLGRYGRLGYDVIERGPFEVRPEVIRSLFDPKVSLAH